MFSWCQPRGRALSIIVRPGDIRSPTMAPCSVFFPFVEVLVIISYVSRGRLGARRTRLLIRFGFLLFRPLSGHFFFVFFFTVITGLSRHMLFPLPGDTISIGLHNSFYRACQITKHWCKLSHGVGFYTFLIFFFHPLFVRIRRRFTTPNTTVFFSSSSLRAYHPPAFLCRCEHGEQLPKRG